VQSFDEGGGDLSGAHTGTEKEERNQDARVSPQL